MSNEVIVKSNRYGIKLILNEQLPFSELLEKVAERFQETGAFFKDAQMAVTFQGRALTVEEEVKIVECIMSNSSIQIAGIVDESIALEQKMKERLEAFNKMYGSTAPQQEAEEVTDFYKGNVRSGQVLECNSSITVIGDVNPGAKVISPGNIVVIGSLKGNAYAGAEGNRSCFIFALEMKPIQLQIGDVLAKSPDKVKESRKNKKSEKEEKGYAPQIAVVRSENICIEPMTKSSLAEL